MKHSFLTIVLGALSLGAAVPAAAADFTKHAGETCPAGLRLAEAWEVKQDPKSACSVLAQWDIARLAGGGSLGGPGYTCTVTEKEPKKLGHVLCAKAPELSAAVGTFAWSVNNGPNGGDTTLNADGQCSNTSSKLSCVWVVSDPTKRQFTLNWANGRHVDTMILTEDGKVIEGKNQGGQAIKGTRK